MIAKRKRLGFLILLVAAYTFVWFVLADMAEARIMQLLAAEQTSGLTITTGKHHKSGYPFALRLTLKDCALIDGSGLAIAAPRIIVGTRLLDTTHITVDAPRGMVAVLPASTDRRALETSVASATGNGHFSLAGLQDIALTLNTVSVEGLGSVPAPLIAASVGLKLEKPESVPTDHTQAGAHVVIDVTKLSLPVPEIPALGNTIDRLTFDAVLMGKVPQLTEASLGAWRNEGGTLEVHELSGQWSDLNFALGGTLALDQSFQPEGSFDARIQGFSEAVDALAGTRAIKGQYADLIKMGLSVLARPDDDQNIPTLHIPVTIQEHKLYLSHFRIMALPEVHLF